MSVGTIQDKLSKFLFTYRITPHSTTGNSPAELLMGRRLRSKLDFLYPDIAQQVGRQQLHQKILHDTQKPVRKFVIGDKVYVEMFFSSPHKWLPGTITTVSGPLSYHIQLSDGRLCRRHVDNIRKCYHEVPIDIPTSDSDLYYPDFPRSSSDSTPSQSVPLRRSTRDRRPPLRYGT